MPMLSWRRFYSLFSIVAMVLVALTLTLPVCLAQEAEPPAEEEPAVFDELQAQLDEYLALMDDGEVEEALVVLAGYLENLKALSESGELSEEDAHAAHVLYMTSKHLAVLARVYETHAEKGNGGGVLNALVSSTKGHGNAYRHMQKETEEGEEPEGEEVEAEGGSGKGNAGGNGKGKGKKK